VAVGVQLLTDKDTYRPDDIVDIRILLTNKTREPIYIRRPLMWGVSASIEIWARDAATGVDLQQKFLSDSINWPPRSRDDFIRLDDEHIYGVLFPVHLMELGITKPGKYELTAIYHSHETSAEFRFGLPSWNGEGYALRANPVVISVVP